MHEVNADLWTTWFQEPDVLSLRFGHGAKMSTAIRSLPKLENYLQCQNRKQLHNDTRAGSTQSAHNKHTTPTPAAPIATTHNNTNQHEPTNKRTQNTTVALVAPRGE